MSNAPHPHPLRRPHTGFPKVDQAFYDLHGDLDQTLRNVSLRGNLVKGIPLKGIRGRVFAFSGTGLDLCSHFDALSFQSGDVVQACIGNGRAGQGYRTGTATIASSAAITSGLVATAAWTSITGLSLGDYLFLVSRASPSVSSESGPPRPTPTLPITSEPVFTSGGWVRVQHGLGRKPVGWQVWRVTGPEPAQLREVYSDSSVIIFDSLVATVVDIWFY